MGETIDRAVVRETRARQPLNANVPTGSLGYDVYPWANGTRDATSQLSSPVSSQRLGHSKCDAPSQLFTPDSQPRHGGSNSSGGSAIVTHHHMWRTLTANIFSLTHSQSCTTRIRDTLAASYLNPKAQDATCLAAETLSASGCWSVSICDIVIPLPASAQWLAANLE